MSARTPLGHVSGFQSAERMNALPQVEEALAHANPCREERRFVVRREALEKGGIARHLGRAVHAQRLGHSGCDEDHPHLGTREQVAKSVDEPVSRPVGNDERVRVLDEDEPGGVALR